MTFLVCVVDRHLGSLAVQSLLLLWIGTLGQRGNKKCPELYGGPTWIYITSLHRIIQHSIYYQGLMDVMVAILSM